MTDSFQSSSNESKEVDESISSSEALSPWVVNLRWQVVTFAASTAALLKNRGRDYYFDPLFEIPITFGAAFLVVAILSGLTVLFFTVSQKKNFWRNQHVGSLLWIAASFLTYKP